MIEGPCSFFEEDETRIGMCIRCDFRTDYHSVRAVAQGDPWAAVRIGEAMVITGSRRLRIVQETGWEAAAFELPVAKRQLDGPLTLSPNGALVK
jgi:hypothetical protein